MEIWELKALLKDIKPAIQEANNRADYARVRWLKQKKAEIKAKIKKLQRPNN